MAKSKKNTKKKGLSEVFKKDTMKKKTLNPFEIHVNRQKYNVLGRNLKTDKGIPGVARAKALRKRKATLLQEYRGKDKANKFFDRRIGEKNSAMTTEDRIMARFTAEKMKMHSKKSIFNLADDEVLTHQGQTLNEIEKFDDPRSSDEEDAEPGKLDASFVEDAHFGGGVLKRADDVNKKSRKDVIEELIAESKRRKAEKQRNREQTIELTEKLDSEWRDLLPIVTNTNKAAGNVEVSKPDSYDTVMKQLIFEARGKPTDRLKSEDEIAREEKERLEKLEADRLRRMHGVEANPTAAVSENKSRMRSADDLDDGFEIESAEETVLAYDAEGRLGDNQPIGAKDDLNQKADSESDVDSRSSEDQENVEDKDTSSSEEDNLSDLKHYSESDDETVKKDELDAKTEDNASKNVAKSNSTKLNTLAIKTELLERKKLMETARSELPYTFQVSESYEQLQELLSNRSPDYQAVIVERMIKCNHPSLAEGNKERLQGLLTFLLQHLDDSAVSDEVESSIECFSVLDRLAPHLYDLAHMAPENAGRSILEVIKEKQADFRTSAHSFPNIDTLVFLKLVSLLFPTSDFRHPVVTPTVIFMEQMLWQCHVRNRRDIAVGLYIVTLLLEYSALSKRFSPGSINFLRGILYLAVEKKEGSNVAPVPPFRKKGNGSVLLVTSEDLSAQAFESDKLMKASDLLNGGMIDDDFKIRALWTSVKLLDEFQTNLEPLTAGYQIFEPVLKLLECLNQDILPTGLKKSVVDLQRKIVKMSEKKIPYLVFEKKKPKALRLYEPHIEQVLDCKRRKPMGPEKQEREKLLHKYKREMKGAVREIRRDRAFLTKLQLKKTLKSDMERKEKVKEIFGSAAIQQGELNMLKRKKDARRQR